MPEACHSNLPALRRMAPAGLDPDAKRERSMAVLKTRNKLVNFRMTQDELDSLKMACLVKGSRNISDFARAAVLESIQAQTEPGMLVQSRLATLDTKVTEIGVSLQFLAELLKSALKKPTLTPPHEPLPGAGRAETYGRNVAAE
jgi:uncharacterized protein (DUF1778 family)